MEKTLLTQNALNKLKKQLDELVLVKRKNIAKEIKVARDFGDLSENAEYKAAREAQAKNEAEIQRIKNILDNYELVKETNDKNKISINSTVDIEYLDNNESQTIKIVSKIEADPLEGFISNESPIGKALLNHTVGETIPVETPSGILNIKISEIK